MHPLIIPTLCLLAGIYFFISNVMLLRDEDKLRRFLATDPRGQFWASKIGAERMLSLSKRFLLPLGLVVSCALFLVGGWSLSQILPGYL